MSNNDFHAFKLWERLGIGCRKAWRPVTHNHAASRSEKTVLKVTDYRQWSCNKTIGYIGLHAKFQPSSYQSKLWSSLKTYFSSAAKWWILQQSVFPFQWHSNTNSFVINTGFSIQLDMQRTSVSPIFNCLALDLLKLFFTLQNSNLLVGRPPSLEKLHLLSCLA